MMALSGVLSSWLMFARNSDLLRFAASACSLAARSACSERRCSVTSSSTAIDRSTSPAEPSSATADSSTSTTSPFRFTYLYSTSVQRPVRMNSGNTTSLA